MAKPGSQCYSRSAVEPRLRQMDSCTRVGGRSSVPQDERRTALRHGVSTSSRSCFTGDRAAGTRTAAVTWLRFVNGNEEPEWWPSVRLRTSAAHRPASSRGSEPAPAAGHVLELEPGCRRHGGGQFSMSLSTGASPVRSAGSWLEFRLGAARDRRHRRSRSPVGPVEGALNARAEQTGLSVPVATVCC